jgi:hypothetical protein
MTTIRCTAKLLKRLGFGNPREPPAPENTLGDWYANILFTRVGHYLILLNERSRLPVLLSARDLHSFERRFLQTLPEILGEIGVPLHQIDRELSLMQPFHIGRTADRSVLGTLNDFGFLAKHWLSPGDLSLYEVNLRLARTPCQQLQSKFPYKETRSLLANPIRYTPAGRVR